MKRLGIPVFFFLVFLLIIPSILADWNLVSSDVTVDINVSGSLIVDKPRLLDDLKIISQYYPRDERGQKVISEEVYPTEYKVEEHYLRYKQPEDRQLTYIFSSKVKSYYKTNELTRRVSYPVDYPKDLSIYTLPSESVDSNHPAIVKTAQDLAKGEDDLFELVTKVAIFTAEHIEYDVNLSLLGTAQPASQILDEQFGVCKEYATLFIALLRALEIPARYVSGVAYTNVDYFSYNWGAHAWAEVYFPGAGWIPFDPTYQQYGWVDPTHVKLQDAIDSSTQSILFEWQDRGTDVTFGGIEVRAEMLEHGEQTQSIFDIEVETLFDETDLESENVLKATIKNTKDYYSVGTFSLARINGVVIEENRQTVVFKPREEKELSWKLIPNGTFEEGYVYTIPLEIYTSHGEEAQTTFNLRSGALKATTEDIVDFQKIAEEKVDQELSFFCIETSEPVFEGEEVSIDCHLEFYQDIKEESVRICVGKDCEDFAIESKKNEFSMSFPAKGNTYRPRLFYDERIIDSFLVVRLKDTPRMLIKNISLPKAVSFTNEYNLTLDVIRISNYHPINVSLEVALPYTEAQIPIPPNQSQTNVFLTIPAKTFSPGKNTLYFNLTYYDEYGRMYSEQDTFHTFLEDIPFYYYPLLYVRKALFFFV